MRYLLIVPLGLGARGVPASHDKLGMLMSGLFEMALTREWKEKEERIIRLPERHPRDFQPFFDFLYFGAIFSAQKSDQGSSDKDREWTR